MTALQRWNGIFSQMRYNLLDDHDLAAYHTKFEERKTSDGTLQALLL
jgi:hypothetical protein